MRQFVYQQKSVLIRVIGGEVTHNGCDNELNDIRLILKHKNKRTNYRSSEFVIHWSLVLGFIIIGGRKKEYIY